MRKHLVCLLWAALVTASLLPVARSDEGKQDILGLKTGMTVAEANKVINPAGWKCQKNISPMAGPAAFTCDTKTGQMNLEFAPNLDGNPLVMIRLFFQSADTIDNVVKSISTQYGKTPSETKGVFRWQLGDQTLRLEQGSKYLLDLVNLPLAEQDQKRARELQLQKNPTPKF